MFFLDFGIQNLKHGKTFKQTTVVTRQSSALPLPDLWNELTIGTSKSGRLDTGQFYLVLFLIERISQ